MIYLAHPVGDPTPEGVQRNVARAGRWLVWLARREPDRAVIAPWLVPLLLGADDHDAVTRERALGLNDRVVARCDGVVLAGGRISPGMEREIAAIEAAGGWVADLTGLGDEPPGSDVRFITSLLTRVIDSPLAWGQRQWAARRAV